MFCTIMTALENGAAKAGKEFSSKSIEDYFLILILSCGDTSGFWLHE